jgi:hypothetical protein
MQLMGHAQIQTTMAMSKSPLFRSISSMPKGNEIVCHWDTDWRRLPYRAISTVSAATHHDREAFTVRRPLIPMAGCTRITRVVCRV